MCMDEHIQNCSSTNRNCLIVVCNCFFGLWSEFGRMRQDQWNFNVFNFGLESW